MHRTPPPTDWLVLRGLAREQGHWGRFPDQLATALRARVHTIDLPGAGTERERPCPTTVRDMADDVRRRWADGRTAGPAEARWGLLGISLGGMLAMQWASDHPEDFVRVVLANTSSRDTSPPWQRMRPDALLRIARAVATRDPLRRETRVLEATTRLQADVGPTAASWAEIATARPMQRANVLRQLLAASRFTAPASLAPPVLVLGGGADPLTHPRCPAALAHRFEAPLVVHPAAGHDLSLDVPEWVAATVAEWATGVRPAAVLSRDE